MTYRRATFRASFGLLLLAVVFGCQKPSGPDAAALPSMTTKGGLEMVLIPAGTFSMGGRGGKEDESPVHKVTLTEFWMDKYEVTQGEYERQNLPNPSHFKGPTLPVEQVTWVQAAAYCNARSKADGLQPCYNEDTAECNFQADGYRLPTEAEWEYACRAGTTNDYSFGSEARMLAEHAWLADNSGQKTHSVGQKKPNPWGLYDMHGNVAEWCNDVFDKGYYRNSPSADPHGPTGGDRYVLRGGSWKSPADALKSSYRIGENPGFSDACLARDAIGFRCVRKSSVTSH